MANQLPCPNPVCSHVFSSAEVQSAKALKCPACGQVFQFRAGGDKPTGAPAPAKKGTPPPPTNPRPAAKAPAPAQPIAAKAVPSKPSAKPADKGQILQAKPFVPMAAPLPPLPPPVAKPLPPSAKPLELDVDVVPVDVEEPPEPVDETGLGEVFSGADDSGPLVRTRKQRRGWSAKHFLTLAVGLILGAGVVVGAVFGIKAYLETTETGGGVDPLPTDAMVRIYSVRNTKGKDETTFKLVLSKSEWVLDGDMKNRMGVNVAMKNTDKDDAKAVWFAVYSKDFGFAKPREAELLRTGIERLEQYFGEGLELDAKAEPASLCGQTGQRILFKGQAQATWWGYAYMFAHQGFGYWFFIAAPTKEVAEETLTTMQTGSTGFLLASDRRGWREQPPKLESFTTAGGALTLWAPDGVWERFNAKDLDERGELFLFGKHKKDDKDNRKNASVLVIALEKQADLKEAMKSARDYIEEKKKEETKDYRLTPVQEGADGSELGLVEPVGNRPGRIAEYKLQRGEAPSRLMIVAVVNDPDKLYIIQTDCAWENRQIWREDFMGLLRAAKFKKGATAEEQVKD